MKTLCGFGPDKVAITLGSLYLIISLHTSIYGLRDMNYDFFGIFTVGLSIACLLSSILLILGVLEKRHPILIPWLTVNLVIITVLSLGLFYLIYQWFKEMKISWQRDASFIMAIAINSITLGFQLYLWHGIYFLYQKYKVESKRLYRLPDEEDDIVVV